MNNNNNNKWNSTCTWILATRKNRYFLLFFSSNTITISPSGTQKNEANWYRSVKFCTHAFRIVPTILTRSNEIFDLWNLKEFLMKDIENSRTIFSALFRRLLAVKSNFELVEIFSENLLLYIEKKFQRGQLKKTIKEIKWRRNYDEKISSPSWAWTYI